MHISQDLSSQLIQHMKLTSVGDLKLSF